MYGFEEEIRVEEVKKFFKVLRGGSKKLYNIFIFLVLNMVKIMLKFLVLKSEKKSFRIDQLSVI